MNHNQNALGSCAVVLFGPGVSPGQSLGLAQIPDLSDPSAWVEEAPFGRGAFPLEPFHSLLTSYGKP